MRWCTNPCQANARANMTAQMENRAIRWLCALGVINPGGTTEEWAEGVDRCKEQYEHGLQLWHDGRASADGAATARAFEARIHGAICTGHALGIAARRGQGPTTPISSPALDAVELSAAALETHPRHRLLSIDLDADSDDDDDRSTDGDACDDNETDEQLQLAASLQRIALSWFYFRRERGRPAPFAAGVLEPMAVLLGVMLEGVDAWDETRAESPEVAAQHDDDFDGDLFGVAPRDQVDESEGEGQVQVECKQAPGGEMQHDVTRTFADGDKVLETETRSQPGDSARVEESAATAKAALVLREDTAEAIACAMFEQLTSVLCATKGGKGTSDVGAAYDLGEGFAMHCDALQKHLLSKCDPALLECLCALQSSPPASGLLGSSFSAVSWLGPWLRLSFGTCVGGGALLDLWDWLLDAHNEGVPMLGVDSALPHLAVSLILRGRRQLLQLQEGGEAQLQPPPGATNILSLLSVDPVTVDDAPAIIEQTQRLMQPELAATVSVTEAALAAQDGVEGSNAEHAFPSWQSFAATSVAESELLAPLVCRDSFAHDILVVEFGSGPLGLLLRQLGGALAVIGLQRVPSLTEGATATVSGPAELAGVRMGDELLAINGNMCPCGTLAPMSTVVAAITATRSAGHRLFLTFWHAMEVDRPRQMRRLLVMQEKQKVVKQQKQQLQLIQEEQHLAAQHARQQQSHGIDMPHDASLPHLLGGERILAYTPATSLGVQFPRTLFSTSSYSRFVRNDAVGVLWVTTYRLLFCETGTPDSGPTTSWQTPLLCIARLEAARSTQASKGGAVATSAYMAKGSTRLQQKHEQRLRQWVRSSHHASSHSPVGSNTGPPPREPVVIVCKSGAAREFALPVSGPEGVLAQRLLAHAISMAFPASTGDFFCFSHSFFCDAPCQASELHLPSSILKSRTTTEDDSADVPSDSAPVPTAGLSLAGLDGLDGWRIYNPHREFRRLGFASGGASSWRVLNQEDSRGAFWLCPTYPRWLVVPSAMTDGELRRAASFRTKSRLVVPTWRHPVHGGTIARSAQPRVGLGKHRNRDDEKLVWLMSHDSAASAQATTNAALAQSQATSRNTHDQHSETHRKLMVGGFRCRCYIIDCRGKLASTGNMLKGKGTERSKNYKGSQILHMQIGNIHSLRSSFQAIVRLCHHRGVAPGTDWQSQLDATGWLRHVQMVLRGIHRTAQLLEVERSSVLVHCSDGWDRTAQLAGGAELLLDPFSRTIVGLQVLIEKQWCSFGFKFADRCGHGRLQNTLRDQIMRQHPTAFEFNEALLIAIIDNVYSCRFGTFMFNCEADRVKRDLRSNTVSLWTAINSRIELFKNERYVEHEGALFPSFNPKYLRLWHGYWLRHDFSAAPRSNFASRCFY